MSITRRGVFSSLSGIRAKSARVPEISIRHNAAGIRQQHPALGPGPSKGGSNPPVSYCATKAAPVNARGGKFRCPPGLSPVARCSRAAEMEGYPQYGHIPVKQGQRSEMATGAGTAVAKAVSSTVMTFPPSKLRWYSGRHGGTECTTAGCWTAAACISLRASVPPGLHAEAAARRRQRLVKQEEWSRTCGGWHSYRRRRRVPARPARPSRAMAPGAGIHVTSKGLLTKPSPPPAGV